MELREPLLEGGTSIDPGAPPGSGAPPPLEGAVLMLQRHLSEVCAGAAAVTISDYEAGDVDALVERSQALLSSALDALAVVAVLYGEGPSATIPGELDETLDGPPSSPSPTDHDGITDAVFLARMGMRQRLRSLHALGERATPWERLAAAGSALRTIQKSLSAVDRAMADAERVPPSLRFYEDAVERSLAVRRRYLQLHRLLARSAPPSDKEMRPRLRLAGNAIALLLGSPEAPHLRPGDRALLMMAHVRVREQLTRRDDDPACAESRRRLWQDLVNSATMFLDVNRREELVQHDARLAREALRDMEGDLADQAARAALFAKLAAMAGRSPVIDAILEGPPEAADMDELRRALGELDRTLGAGGVTF